LTQEYKLIPAIKKDLALTNLENMNEYEVARYKIYMAISENLQNCFSMNDLVARLKHQGIDTQFKYKGKTEEIQGVSFKMGSFSFKGSQVDRQFSFAGLQKALSERLKQNVENVADQKEDIHTSPISKEVLRKRHSIIKPVNKALEILMKPEQTEKKQSHKLKR
jgi:hypothetical protein